MFTLRCTQRLLNRLKTPRAELAAPTLPSTLLGDWYASLVYVGRLQLVLAVSERTFLPVVLPAAPASSFIERVPSGVAAVLQALNIEPTAIEQELAEMKTVALGRTASRQVTGVLVDLAKGIELYLERDPSLLACALALAKTPCSPLYKTHCSPDRATVALLRRE